MARQMTEPEAAWFAGLFDGEGCIKFISRASVVLAISMTDLDVLEQAQRITGVGNIRPCASKNRNKPAHWKDQWVWDIGSRDDVIRLIEAMLPWLGERRSTRCLEALVRLESNRSNNLPIVHGTVSGYFRERKLGLTTCQACRDAHCAQTKANVAKRKVA